MRHIRKSLYQLFIGKGSDFIEHKRKNYRRRKAGKKLIEAYDQRIGKDMEEGGAGKHSAEIVQADPGAS